MEVTTPPAGSLPYGIPVRAPDGSIYVGRTGSYTELARIEDVDFVYVNIKDFGAVGDGVTDDTAAFNAALAEAKSTNNMLFLPDGTYPVEFTNDSIDMNGCIGITGSGTLVLTESGTTDVESPVLQWEGTKVLASGSISGSFNQRQFTIDTGLDINKGDTMFLVCSDPFYPDSEEDYYKGCRFTVEQYNPSTGNIAMYEYLPFDFSQGWLYWNQYRPKVELSGVEIIMNTQNYKRGINISAGIVYANAVSIIGSSRCLMVSSSLGRVTNSRMCVNDNIPTQTGYGVQSAGLTDLYIEGSNIYGFRHAVACGDWGWWRTGDIFITPDADANMPSICRISGCRLSGTGNTYCIDSHGGVLLLDVFNCDVYGGVQFGGLENYISDSRIYQAPEINQTFRFGRDRDVSSGYFLSKYAIRNCIVFCKREFVWIQPDIESVELVNVDVRISSDTVSRNMIRYYQDQPKIKNLTVKDLRITSPSGEVVDFLFKSNSSTVIDGIISENASISVKAEDVGETSLSVSNISVSGSNGYGLKVYATGTSDKVTELVAYGISLKDNNTGTILEGIKSISIISSIFSSNGSAAIIDESASVGKVNVSFSKSIIIQQAGNVIDGTTENVDAVFIGNIFDGTNAIAGVNIIGKYGNIGLSDDFAIKLGNFINTWNRDYDGNDRVYFGTSVPGNDLILKLSQAGGVFSIRSLDNSVLCTINSEGIITSANVNELPAETFTVDYGGTISPGFPVLQTVTVPGAEVGDLVLVSKINTGSSVSSNFIMTAMVNNNSGQIGIFGINAGTSDITVNSINIRVKVFK